MYELTDMNGIYVDNNATTRCAPDIVAAMLPYFSDVYGNSSSPHGHGRQAAKAVYSARCQIAQSLNCAHEEVFITSGATESNNIAILGLAQADTTRRRIVTSSIEHKSVLEPLAKLETSGFEIVSLPVTTDGIVDVEYAQSVINDQTLLVSVQGANNEVGTIQPVEAIARLAHQCGALVHCDAVQMLAKVPLSVRDLDLDLASFSCHKAYGPKGVGCLYIRSGQIRSAISPILWGGGQERGIRPGTVNVGAVVGFAEACRLGDDYLFEEGRRLEVIRDKFERRLSTCIPSCLINGARVDRLPGTSNIAFPGIPADMLIANTPEVHFSSGSACTSGALEPSHVLIAMGLDQELAESSVRISFGRYNTLADSDAVVDAIVVAIEKIEEKGMRLSPPPLVGHAALAGL